MNIGRGPSDWAATALAAHRPCPWFAYRLDDRTACVFEEQPAELDLNIQRLFSRIEHPIETISGIHLRSSGLDTAELHNARLAQT